MSDLVRVATEARGAHGQVATVTIDNAARMNSLSSAVIAAFVDAVERASADPDLRVLVVTGAGGRSFIGGADIFEMNGLDPLGARRFITGVHRLCHVLRECPVPTIARIDGWCLGAGLEAAAACDLRVASDTSMFGMPEVRVGLPSVVEAALLPQLVGWGRAKQLVYTAENIDAKTALAWGLVEEVVPAAELDAAVERMVGPIVESAPRAVRLQKELVRQWEASSPDAAIEAGIRIFARAYETDEPRQWTGKVVAELEARRAAKRKEKKP